MEPVLLPDGAEPPCLIVCERSGEWAVALRTAVAKSPGDRRILETRSLGQCWDELARRPSSFVVVELATAEADALLERLARIERRFPLAGVAVVADRTLADYEPLVREAGAVHFVDSPRQAESLARLACNHLERAASPRRSVRETILAGLPWAPPADR